MRNVTRRESFHELVRAGILGTVLGPAIGRARDSGGPQNEECLIGRAAEARKLFPANVRPQTIGGVRCDVITPLPGAGARRDQVLFNVHGGGFVTDSGSLVEGIPMAHLARTTVVSGYYRAVPEHPYPAAVDDTVAVYRELLKTHKAKNMELFGTSAGAVLTAELASALKHRTLPLPGALGAFSGFGDFSKPGDTQSLFTIWGFRGYLNPPKGDPINKDYVGNTNPREPVPSPIYSDLHSMPPTLPGRTTICRRAGKRST